MLLVLLHLKARLRLLRVLLGVLGYHMMLECRLGLWSQRALLRLELLELLEMLRVLRVLRRRGR